MNTLRRRLRTLEAMLLISGWALALKLLPARFLLPPDHGKYTSLINSEKALAVRGAIRSACARLPCQPACFSQSLAAVALLRRRRISHTLYIGARKAQGIQAHSWVEASGIVVAGEGDVGSYSVLLARQG